MVPQVHDALRNNVDPPLDYTLHPVCPQVHDALRNNVDPPLDYTLYPVCPQVHDALRNIGRVPDPGAVMLPIVGCEGIFHYRNNMEVRVRACHYPQTPRFRV